MHMRPRLAFAAVLLMGCSGMLPMPDAGSSTETCTVSTCDEAVGTWDTATAPDGGATCSLARFPPVTLYRDAGSLCTSANVELSHPATKTLGSNGGCALTLRITEVPRTSSLSAAADQTWTIAVRDGGFDGTNEVVVCCDVNCRSTTRIVGTRR